MACPTVEVTILLASLCFSLLLPPMTTQASAVEGCVLVDSDADLDDYRAIAALASTKQIRAIIVTEGISRPAQGTLAMQDFLRRSDLEIPVVLGASPDPHRNYEERSGFKEWRAAAESLNGTLDTRGLSSLSQTDIALALRPYINKCAKITLLVIGPWTSFVRYAAELLPKVDRIVAQGRPYPDEDGGEPDGLNCTYDEPSCLAAFDLLVGRQRRAGRRLRTSWVDIPNNVEVCGLAEAGVDRSGKRQYAFAPREDWLESLLKAGGRAKVIADILKNNVNSWKNKTSLWDDLAALYIIRPELFGVRGGHLEPCISAASVRNILAELMSKG